MLGYARDSRRAESQLCHLCSDRPGLGLKRTGGDRGWCMPDKVHITRRAAELHANGRCTKLGPLAKFKAR